MLFTVQRRTLGPTSLIGDLLAGAAHFGYTLEPRADRPEHPAIPAGTYSLTLEPTHNTHLWSPYPDRCLPHVWGVPGRAGIEMHAGNISADTEGCIIVATYEGSDAVSGSRPAVTALVDLLRAVPGPHQATVVDIPAQPSAA